MKRSARWITPAFLGILIALLAAMLFYPGAGTAAPLMTTDKADYFAAETVTVTGSGFVPNTQYDVPIIRPDGSLVKGDGTLTPGWDTVTSNASGSFTYLYKLDGIFGSYEARAYPVSWSGNLADGPLTSVIFTDADIDFSQCSNDDNGDNAPEACKWVTGALNTSNSIYTEGQAVPQRLFHKLTDVGAYQFEFEYDFSKASVYAYDFLTSADQGPQNTLALLNPCADAPAFASACSTITNSLYTGSSTVPIPSDPFDSVSGAEAAVATRNFRVACSGPGSCSAVAVFFPSGNGGDDPGENHVPDSDPDCMNTLAPRCGTASVKIRLSVTTPAGTSNSSPTLVAIWFGGHLSYDGYWGTTGCGSGGTSRCGAASISGSPFHLDYSCLDEPDSPDKGCASVGSRSNQLSASTVTAGNIVITKDVVTQSGTHPQDFSFSCTPTLGSFTLDDDGANGNPLNNSQTFSTVPAATYTCTESAPSSGWSLTGLSCSDPDGGTTVNVGTRTATIDLDNLETVSCTYTNTATGTINVVKDAVPNDAQDFGFSCTSPLGSFSLDDDANPTLSNTQTFSGTLAGSYTCTESAPPSPWNLASISCSDPDAGTTTNTVTRTANIDLDPGETITCTFTNDKGTVTIIKDAVPNHAQDFSFTGTCFSSFSLDDDADGTLSNTQSGNVAVGSCTVTESAPAPGWTLTNIVCSDPDSGTTVNLGTRTATIDVDAGESITCTFTNTGTGTIVIQKVCDPTVDPQLFTFSRSYGANVNIGCGGTNSTSLGLGTYSVSETVPAGWDLTSATCSSSIGDTETPGSIEVDPGETVTCTFNNQKDANIIVCKQTDPDGSSQSFEFVPSYGTNFFLTDGICHDSGDIDPGTYSVSETVPPGWVLSSSSCSDGSSIAAINLSAGETVTCTFNDTKTGSITIVKDAIPNGTQGFYFTCSSPIGPFTLDDDGTNGNPFDNSKTTSGLLPGTYGCSEALPAGWALTSLTCVDPSGGTTTTSTPVFYPGSGTATIALAAGEDVTCTFVNTQLGSITIIKDAVPNSAQDFSFTCSAPIGSFSLDDDANGTLSNTQGPVTGLLPGGYSCSETVPASWALSSISCAGDSDNGSVVALPGVTIDLDAGENITCTFTNTQGSITIVKDTDPNGPQDFCFNGDLPDANGAGTGDFCLDDDGDLTLSNSHSVSATPGTYAVNELGPTAGFDLTSITCVDPDTGTTVNLGTATATIDLDAGESITCTFTNTQRGHILVDKVTDPAGSSQSFEFDPSYGPNFFLADASPANDSGALVPGTYSVAEVNIPAGWDLTSATCSDASNPASIALGAGETVTCTFTDTQRGHIVICKETNPDGSSQSFEFDPSYGANFLLTDGQCNDSGALVPGSYTVSEVNLPADWMLTGLVCADPDNGSSPSPPTANVDLDPGETVTCTFTDTKSGSITIVKDAVPNDAQDFSFTCSAPLGIFSLDDDADGTLSNTTGPVSVTPGTYSCSEAAVSGWTQTSATCSDGSPVSAINVSAGENVTCTFVNTKLGSITIIKDAVPNDAQDISFTCDAPIGSFTLDDDGANGNPLDNSKTQGGLMPSSYTCTETVPSGWALSSISCTGDTDSGSVVISASVTIDLDAGENITCTFTNAQGSITIVKNTVPNGPQDFCFNGDLPDANGTGTGDFCLDDDLDGTLSDAHSVNVPPGTYAVNELGPTPGYQLTSISCADPDSGTTVNLGTSTATIDLDAGESITCTFTNTADGRIIVKKVCDPASDPQTFAFTPTGYGAAFSLGCGAQNDSGFLTPGGSYAVSETNPGPNWVTTAACDNGSSIFSIQVSPGETVTCTFTNVKNGSVVINKTCAGGNDTFGYTGTGSGISSFTITCAGGSGSQSFLNIAPGAKTVTESSLPAGWTLTSLMCADPDSGSSPSGATANIDLDPGETVTCTFTNTKNGSITIVKDAVPDDPQDFSFTCSAPVGSFSLDDDAEGTLSNTKGPVSVTPGTYSCSEAVVSGWTQTSATCSDGSPVSAIAVAPGENVTCTFTNTKNGSITIIKDAVPNDPQDFSFTCSAPVGTFSLDDDADGTLSNTKGPVSVTPGTYSCSEAAASGWTQTSATCNDGSGVSAINVGAGENVTCTFVNTKNGSITIIKDALPNDPQDFSFTCSAPLGGFPLDDDANGVLSNTKGPVSVTPGTYNCSEAAVSGWTQTSATCSDGSPVSAINVAAGENVTCTFVNALNAASFNVAKNFVPDFPGTDPDVIISLTCTSGTIAASDPTANEETPDTANFTIYSFTTPASCTATEPMTPTGYTKNESACQAIPISVGSSAFCTITNTAMAATPTPTPPAVGGVVSLSAGDVPPSSGDNGADAVALGALGAGTALAVAGVWVARRRLLR